MAAPLCRAAGKDLDDAGPEPDQHTNLPGAIIRSCRIEDQAAPPSTERRADLVHDESDPEQGRHIAGAEHLGDETADQRATLSHNMPSAAAKTRVLAGVGGIAK